jgi:hypothetical protein
MRAARGQHCIQARPVPGLRLDQETFWRRSPARGRVWQVAGHHSPGEDVMPYGCVSFTDLPKVDASFHTLHRLVIH